MLCLKKRKIYGLKRELSRHRKVVILIHHNPDGDALGSSLALSMYLKQKGHEVCVIAPNEFPEFLQWMPESESVHMDSLEPEFCRSAVEHAGFIFCLDFNQSSRIKSLQESLDKSKAYKALIDHHIEPSPDFDFTYSVTTETSSTCELVYNFIAYCMGDKSKITVEMAQCLYVGITTDTGSLSYSCDNPSTYHVVGQLIGKGIHGEAIHRKVYDTYSESRMRLLGFCLSERMVVLEGYATSYIFLSKEDLERFHYKQGDTEGVVNYGLSMQTVRFTAFFSEKEGHIRISFRSKGDFDVNAYARKHFHGGGHKNAAGGESDQSMEECIALFRSTLEQYKDSLTKKD